MKNLFYIALISGAAVAHAAPPGRLVQNELASAAPAAVVEPGDKRSPEACYLNGTIQGAFRTLRSNANPAHRQAASELVVSAAEDLFHHFRATATPAEYKAAQQRLMKLVSAPAFSD